MVQNAFYIHAHCLLILLYEPLDILKSLVWGFATDKWLSPDMPLRKDIEKIKIVFFFSPESPKKPDCSLLCILLTNV
jgi:hypothetical protein